MKSSKTFRTLCLAVACAAFAFSPAVCAQAQAVDFLANFNGVNGNSPNAVIQATDGNFYGTAYFGGTATSRISVKTCPPATVTASMKKFGTSAGTTATSSTANRSPARLMLTSLRRRNSSAR